MTSTGKVLFINDDPSIGDQVKRWLARQGYHCVIVDTAEDADRLLQRLRFDAVVYGHEFSFSPEPLFQTLLLPGLAPRRRPSTSS